MSADAESTKATASKTTASASIAIAGRLLGKELHRLKLKWLDLQGADLRLGEKAYATGKVDGQSELSTKLDGVRQRITQLRERQGQTPSTFGGKVKAFATKVRKTLQIGALQLKRRRLLRRLGASLRQGGTNSSEEARSASAVADHITSVETAIADLRPQTYPWARRPLLITCLLLLLAAVGAFALRHKPTSVLAQQRGAAGRSSLSDEQMNKVVAQQQTFQQQMQHMVAEATTPLKPDA